MAKEPRDDTLTPKESTIRQAEMAAWLHDSSDAHLEWAVTICDSHAKPPKIWKENVEIARRILAWRRQGPDGPFR